MDIKDVANDDLLDIFVWRNDPISRHNSICNNKVSLDEHKNWFENSLLNPLRKIYIGIIRNEKVGICRFDKEKQMNSAEVSINLNPSMRGKNLSYDLLSNSLDIYKKNNQIKLTATIKKDNRASLRIFQKCNFIIVSEDINFYYLMQIEFKKQ